MQLDDEVDAGDRATWGTGWARGMLEIDGSDVATGQRLLLGLALSWAFGLGVAAVTGAWTASLGLPAMLALVGSVGVPSVVIGLVLARSELDARDAARAAVHGIATTGLLLGGFAPATVLYLVGTHEPGVRWLITTVAIAAAGTIGLARMGHALFVSSRAQATRVERVVLVAIFAVFSAALGQRVWASVGVDLAAMPRGAEVAR